MTSGKHLYTHLAELVDYPQKDIVEKVESCLSVLAQHPEYPQDVTKELKSFKKDIESIPLEDLQGVYSYTFELSFDTTLDLGAHLFDGFKRASSLSSMKSMYKDVGFPFDEISKGELPDHLPNVLRFLGFVQDEELKKDFRKSFVNMAMEKLHRNIKDKRNVYSHLVSVIYRIIDTDVKAED